MKDVYSKPVSPELDRDEKQHYKVVSVSPDAIPGNFVAKYEVLDDEKGEFFPFEIRIPADAGPEHEAFKAVFTHVALLYSRKEDILSYGYKIIHGIISDLFKQTKKEAPKKTPAAKAAKPAASAEEDKSSADDATGGKSENTEKNE